MQLTNDQLANAIAANHGRRKEPREPVEFDWDSAIERLKRMLGDV
jgi:hypothetical protein